MSTYFKKSNPAGPVFVDGGKSKVVFDAANASVGYLKVEGKELAAKLHECIKQGIGGMTEVSKKEYDEFFQKKTSNPSPRIWRDEVTKSGLAHMAVPLPPPAPHVGQPAPAAAVSSAPTPEDTEAAHPKVRKGHGHGHAES